MSGGARWSFPTGVDAAMSGWGTGGTFRVLLAKSSWLPDPSVDVYVSAVAAHELTDASYARQTLSNLTRAVQLPGSATEPGYVVLTADPFSFGVLAGGETAAWVAVYRFVTNDTDSPLVCAFATRHVADGSTSADYTPPATGIVRLSTVCPEDYS